MDADSSSSANSTQPAAVPPPSTPDVRALLNLAVAVLVIAALFIAQDVLVPIVLAVILSFVLSPLVTRLGRAGLPRALSVLTAVFLTFGILVLAAALLARQASNLAADAPRYASTLEQKFEHLNLLATSQVSMVSRLFSRLPARPIPSPAVQLGPAAAPQQPTTVPPLPAAPGRPVQVEVVRTESSPFTVARTFLEPVLAPVETTVIVLVIAIFILMQREELRDRLIRLAGSDDLHRTTTALDDAGERLSRYFLSQVAVNGTFGIVIGLGLYVIGIPSAPLWGVLAGLLRFVPYIGPIIAVVPPLALAAAVDPDWWRAVEVALLFVVVEPLTGYVVEPLLYGHSTGLAPISVIVAAVFWTWMWGPIGLILSTPLTLCLVVAGRHIASLEFLDVLLGDRPALAPGQNLYQRMLSDNPDEVFEKAEVLLADRSLLAFYDGVMLPGLILAAQDEARRRLTPQRAAGITRALLQVVDDLKVHQDDPAHVAPVSVRDDVGMVACLAGRGPFDDVVSAMLCQILGREGVKTRRLTHAQVSREHIADLDLSDVSVIALSYLDMTGSLPHLRFLMRRLRLRAPSAAVVVGLWPEGETAEIAQRQAIGADAYVTSLRDTLEFVARSGSRSRR